MRTTTRFYACAAVVVLACNTLAAQEKRPGQSYESTVTQRIDIMEKLQKSIYQAGKFCLSERQPARIKINQDKSYLIKS